MGFGSFAILDYVVFVGTILLSLAIGLYYAFVVKQKTNKDFLVGGRQMGVFPIAMSLLATYMSAVLILGYTSEVYNYGTLLSEVIISFTVWVPLGSLVFLPTFYKLKLTSVYEYLEIRFRSPWVRWLASLTFIVQIILYLGVVLFSPSLALDSVLDFPIWASILCVGGSATIYTSMGGLRAVVWTDVFQVFMYLAGLVAVVIKGSMNLGGLDKAIEIANDHGRIQFFNFDPNPFNRLNSLAIFFGQGLLWLSYYGCHQTQVQRYCSMSSFRNAYKALLLNVPLIAFTMGMAVLAGIVIFANYATCDVVSIGLIKRADQIAPFFVVDNLSVIPGMVGLFVACLFSGALSTVSSGVNSLAAVTWEDFFRKIDYFKNMGEERQANITKLLAVAYGAICICMAFMAQNLGGILSAAITVNGSVAGPLLGVFTLGFLLPFTNKVGAIVGMLLGHCMTLWISVGALMHGDKHPQLPFEVSGCPDYLASHNLTHRVAPTALALSNGTTSSLLSTTTTASLVEDDDGFATLYSVSFLLYPFVGWIVTVFVGIVVSLFTGPMTMDSDMEAYVFPPVVKMIHYLRRRKYSVSDLPMNHYDNETFTMSKEKGLEATSYGSNGHIKQ